MGRQVEIWLWRRSRVWRVWERGLGWGCGWEPILLVLRMRVCRLGRVRMPASELRVVRLLFDRSIEWTVEGRVASVLDSQASSSLLVRMMVCSAGRDEVRDDISAGSSRVSARPRYRIFGRPAPRVETVLRRRFPSKVKECSFGKRRHRRRISSQVSKRLPPRSRVVMLAHSSATERSASSSPCR